MSQRESQLGIFGTFDIENYGDLLFPLLAEAELSQRLGPLKLQCFSYGGKTPPDWPYIVTSLTELPARAGDLDGVIIGGGHIIRFDKSIAPGYAPPVATIHHPTGYWLTPILIALQHGTPVVWNAPAVHGDIPAWADPLLRLAINGSRYVSVRDEPSRQALAHFAGDDEIKVVPDAAFGISRLLDRRRPSSDFARLRDAHGLNEPYIIVQATPALRDFASFVREHRELFRQRKLLILPTGPVAGDHHAALGEDLPGAIRLEAWPGPLLMAELIGHATAVVAVSLHLSITALAFGVPVFRPARSFGGKYAILAGLEGVFPLDAEGGIDPRRFDGGAGGDGPSPAVAAALRRLNAHWDSIAAIFLAARVSPPPLEAVSRFWQTLPGLLEARDGQDAARDHAKLRKITGPLRRLGRMRRREDGRDVIDLTRIEQCALSTQPYEWAFVGSLFAPEDAAALVESYPRDHFKTVRGYDDEKGYEYEARALIGMGGGAVSNADSLSPVWRRLADDLLSPAYRAALARLTGLDLAPLPMEVNVFHYGPGSWLGPHVDLREKVVTHVFYFNERWDEADGGCLAVLRSSEMSDAFASVAPVVGNSVVLVRSDKSWHAVSPVARGCRQSRLSRTVTFYRHGSISTMWPPGEMTPLHYYDGTTVRETAGAAATGATGLRARLYTKFASLLRARRAG